VSAPPERDRAASAPAGRGAAAVSAPDERGRAVSAPGLLVRARRAWLPLAVAALIVALAVVPPAVGGYLPRALTSYFIFGLLALAVGLISGYGRLFNLGVGATFGVAAYAVAVLSQLGVTNPFLLLAGALGAGLLVALLFAFYALVASGTEYLMLTFLTTLAFAVLPLAAPDLLGGDNGLALKGDLGVSFGLNPLRGNEFYWFVLAVVVGCALLSWFLVSSQAGQAVQAIGRNPVRAAAMGYSVGGYRVALTLYASLIAALGGWLYILQNSFVHQDLLGLGNSTNGLVYALTGGVSSILGPFLGAIALRFVNDTLSRGSTQTPLYLGIVLMLVVYFVPDGLLGLWARYRPGRRHAVTEPVAESVAATVAGPGSEKLEAV
jgi:branched-chain amino acid transport system permease protein